MNEAEAKSPAPAKTARKRKKDRSFWKELPVLIVVALFLTLIIKTYAIQAFYIPSGSMQNTLAIGDRVLVDKLSFEFGNVHRGDIVVFSGDGTWDPGVTPASTNFFSRFGQSVASMFGFAKNQNDFIKRVIGLPGDKVACCDAQGRLTVNGKPVDETYLKGGGPASLDRFSTRVPAHELFLLGDNRAVSEDSRVHLADAQGGSVPVSDVRARVDGVAWHSSRMGLLSRTSAFTGVPGSGSPGQGPLGLLVISVIAGVVLILGGAAYDPVAKLLRRK